MISRIDIVLNDYLMHYINTINDYSMHSICIENLNFLILTLFCKNNQNLKFVSFRVSNLHFYEQNVVCL